MESLDSVIGLKYSGYFLNLYKALKLAVIQSLTDVKKGIIVNILGVFTSFELLPGFYRYGYRLPFYNSVIVSLSAC